MNYSTVREAFARVAIRVLKSSRFVALGLVASFTSLAIQPAQAQSSDRWKSIVIIGGATPAGAYIGHKVAGTGGAVVGATVGASAGYAIDQRRRANQYNQYAYGDGGYYGNDGGYYGSDDGYYGDGGYNDGPYDDGAYPYPSAYQSKNYRSSNRLSPRR